MPALLFAVLAAPAAAQDEEPASSCSYEPVTGVVHIDLAQWTHPFIERGGTGSAPDDPITLDGTPCGEATVSNTDTILIGHDSGFDAEAGLRLAGGPLAP